MNTPTPPRPAWRFLRRLALALATYVVLIALGYGVENLRGWLEWRSERDRVIASGASLEWEHFIPPRIPDDANFAQIPLLRPLLEYDTTLNDTHWRDTNGFHRCMRMFNYYPGWRSKGPNHEPLIPAFMTALPEDPGTHQPLKYQRDTTVGFRLWCVGEDGIDNSGASPETASDTRAEIDGNSRVLSGDWVWRIPAAER